MWENPHSQPIKTKILRFSFHVSIPSISWNSCYLALTCSHRNQPWPLHNLRKEGHMTMTPSHALSKNGYQCIESVMSGSDKWHRIMHLYGWQIDIYQKALNLFLLLFLLCHVILLYYISCLSPCPDLLIILTYSPVTCPCLISLGILTTTAGFDFWFFVSVDFWLALNIFQLSTSNNHLLHRNIVANMTITKKKHAQVFIFQLLGFRSIERMLTLKIATHWINQMVLQISSDMIPNWSSISYKPWTHQSKAQAKSTI